MRCHDVKAEHCWGNTGDAGLWGRHGLSLPGNLAPQNNPVARFQRSKSLWGCSYKHCVGVDEHRLGGLCCLDRGLGRGLGQGLWFNLNKIALHLVG